MADAACISENALAALKRLRQKRPAAERCEICALPLDERHAHLLESDERRIVCACDPCSCLFQEGAGRYRRIPRDAFFMADFALDDLQWESLSIPINLAFLFFSSKAGRMVAFYPSPAGATESLLNLEAWEEVARNHPRVKAMEPDVVAFLANRIASPPEYFVVPIDRCYELTGIVRKHWQGFTGGDDVWREIRGFFAALREQSIVAEAQRA